MTEYSLIIKLDPSQAVGGVKAYKRELIDAKTSTEALGPAAARASDQIVAGLGKATTAANNYGNTAEVVGEKEAAAANRAAQARALASQKIVAIDRYRKIQLGYQLNDIGVSLAGGMNPLMVMAQQGTQISQIYSGQGGVKQALLDTGKAVGGLATKMPLLTTALAAGGIAVMGMRNQINETSKIAVSFGDVALAAFQVIGQGIATLIKPAVDALAPWFKAAWDKTIGFTKDFINNLVTLVLGSFEMIKTAVYTLPDAFIAAGEMAANGFLEAMYAMADKTLVLIDELITSIGGSLKGTMLDGAGNALLSMPVLQGSIGKAPKIDIGGADAAKRLTSEWEKADKKISKIANTDYAGKFYENVKKASIANAIERAEDEKGAGSKRKKADATDKLAKALQNLRQNMASEIAGLEMEKQALGLSDQEATKLRKSFEWLKAAKQAGIAVTPQLISEIDREAGAYAKLSVEVEKAAAKKQQMESFAQGIGSAFGSMLSGLGSNFKNMGEYLKNFGVQLLDLMVDIFVIQPMIESLKASMSGGSSSGGGGLLSGLFGAIGSFFGFKDGGSVKAPLRLASGGSVWGAGTSTSDSIDAKLSDGEYVINAKSAAKNRPLLDQINSGTFKQSEDRKAANANSYSSNTTNAGDTMVIHINGARGNAEIEMMVAQGVKAGMKQQNKKAAITHVNSTKEATRRGYR